MSEIRPADLFGRLNRLGYKAMESATTFCKLRGNPKVELVHFIFQVLNEQDSDLHRIIQHFSLDTSKLSTHLQRSLDFLPRGASSISGFSQTLRESVEQGWVYGSLMYKQGKIRTGHIIVGLLKSPGLTSFFLALSDEFRKIPVDVLTSEFASIVATSPEEGMAETVGAGAVPGEASGAMQGEGKGGSALAQYAVNLTERARKGEIDPILGRDEEILHCASPAAMCHLLCVKSACSHSIWGCYRQVPA